MTVAVRLATRAFDPAEAIRAFTAQAAGAGAVVSFTGIAREIGKDGAVLDALVLESYRSVTLRSMEAIAADAAERFAVQDILVIHRAGRVLPDEPIVLVVTAARHRRAAFDAADYAMDRLKSEAVFWKREEGPAGARWIEPTAGDRQDLARWNAE